MPQTNTAPPPVPGSAEGPGNAPAPSAGASGLGHGHAVLAFDVGGTDMKAALMDEDGGLRKIIRVPTPHTGEHTAEAVLAEIVRLSESLRSSHPDVVPQAAGLLVPGYVNEETGVGIFAENLGWRDVPFRIRAQEILNLPVFFGHDVRGAAQAEYALGPAREYADVVIMVIGTGISGAIFIDGQLHSGGGMAGEMGHSRVADEPECVCGGRGCLEAIASAGAIQRRYNRLTGNMVPGAKEVLERAEAGDAQAATIWAAALDALALDLSHTVALLAPEAIVIGGGLAQAGAALFGPLTERLARLLTYHRMPSLLPAGIGENAGLVGAALGARKIRNAGNRAKHANKTGVANTHKRSSDGAHEPCEPTKSG
ncbi:ROK family protein [Arthrobacter sp. KNU-44]|uniref:ROK family protein n=1 Tax=Arthrobacter sp. KNU-44 TaxID=3450744 RepID=UPI003F4427CF